MLNKCLSMPLASWLIFAAALGSLVFALIMQYGFDLQPCILCLWQRAPFGLVALFSLIASLKKPYGGTTRILLELCAAVFTVGVMLAAFHTGVERHWWLGTSGCAIQPLHGTTTDDIREQLLHTLVARCDVIAWTFLGLSMANWNVPYSLGLAGFSLLAAWRIRK